MNSGRIIFKLKSAVINWVITNFSFFSWWINSVSCVRKQLPNYISIFYKLCCENHCIKFYLWYLVREPFLKYAIVVKDDDSAEHVNTFYDYAQGLSFEYNTTADQPVAVDFPSDMIDVCEFYTINVCPPR